MIRNQHADGITSSGHPDTGTTGISSVPPRSGSTGRPAASMESGRPSTTLEVVEPPPPTPLMLPARVLAAMAVELPRDALESLIDEGEAAGIEAIDDDAVYVGAADDDDDEVTLHGANLSMRFPSSDAHSNPWGNEISSLPMAAGLGGLEGEISSFRRKQGAPSQSREGLDSVFGTAHRSSVAPSRAGGPKSAPPPPPSKKLNPFASRVLFEATPVPVEPSSILPPPPAFADGRDSSYRSNPFIEPATDFPFRTSSPSHPALGYAAPHLAQTLPSQPPAHPAFNHSSPSQPPLGTGGFGASSRDPLQAMRSQLFQPSSRGEEFEDETETQVLVRHDSAETLQPVERFLPTPSSLPPRMPLQRSLTEPPRRGTNWLALGGGSLFGGAALAFLAFYVFAPSKGELIVDVANQQCNVMSNVHIYVDDELACTTTPCRLETAARSHVIYAEAPGYPRTAAEAVVVEAGNVTLHKLQLGASAETGVEVRSRLRGLQLYVDGTPIGELPQRIPGMSAGDHTLLITGGERFYAEERKIHLDENQFLTLDPIDLKLRNGTLLVRSSQTLTDAKVMLDEAHIELPFRQQLDASRRYRLSANKSGYEPFETWVTFDANSADQQVDIQLVPKREGSQDSSSSSHAQSRSSSSSSSSSVASGRGTLNLNSNPVSMVILDGKPIGQTPRVGVAVKAGPHSIVFVNPSKGRKRMATTVAAGSSKNVSVRF